MQLLKCLSLLQNFLDVSQQSLKLVVSLCLDLHRVQRELVSNRKMLRESLNPFNLISVLEGEAWRVCSPLRRRISEMLGEIREAALQGARAYPATSSLRRRLSCVGAGPCERSYYTAPHRAASCRVVRHLSRVP